MVRLVVRHVVHYTSFEHTVHYSSNRDRVAGIAVQKIGGPVQWIHDPDQPGGDNLRAELFTNDAASGSSLLEHPRNDFFGLAVHMGNEIAAAFQGPSCWALRPLHASDVVRGLHRR